MNWNISDIHDFMSKILIRKQRNAFISEADKDAALDRGQMDFFADMFKPYGETQAIHDSLSPFKTPVQFTTADTAGGAITMPTDYLHYLGGYISIFDNTSGQRRLPLPFINEDELAIAMSSQVRKHTTSNPFAYNNNGTIQLYPEVPMNGAYSYLRRPKSPVYAFSQTGRAVTYDPGNSVQLEWAEANLSNIIQKAMVYLGVQLNESDMAQFATFKDEQIKQ